MKKPPPQQTGKAVLLGSLCFAAGWLWHQPDPPVLPEPAECPVCPGPAPTKVAMRPQKLGAAVGTTGPAMPAGYERLRECFSGVAYRGSRFILRLKTSPRGDVTRVTLAGDEFMTLDQRSCVLAQVKTWNLGANVDEDVVLTVVL